MFTSTARFVCEHMSSPPCIYPLSYVMIMGGGGQSSTTLRSLRTAQDKFTHEILKNNANIFYISCAVRSTCWTAAFLPNPPQFIEVVGKKAAG